MTEHPVKNLRLSAIEKLENLLQKTDAQLRLDFNAIIDHDGHIAIGIQNADEFVAYIHAIKKWLKQVEASLMKLSRHLQEDRHEHLKRKDHDNWDQEFFKEFNGIARRCYFVFNRVLHDTHTKDIDWHDFCDALEEIKELVKKRKEKSAEELENREYAYVNDPEPGTTVRDKNFEFHWMVVGAVEGYHLTVTGSEGVYDDRDIDASANHWTVFLHENETKLKIELTSKRPDGTEHTNVAEYTVDLSTELTDKQKRQIMAEVHSIEKIYNNPKIIGAISAFAKIPPSDKRSLPNVVEYVIDEHDLPNYDFSDIELSREQIADVVIDVNDWAVILEAGFRRLLPLVKLSPVQQHEHGKEIASFIEKAYEAINEGDYARVAASLPIMENVLRILTEIAS